MPGVELVVEPEPELAAVLGSEPGSEAGLEAGLEVASAQE